MKQHRYEGSSLKGGKKKESLLSPIYHDEDSVHVLDISNIAAPLLGNHGEGSEM